MAEIARIPCRQGIMSTALPVLSENNFMPFVYTENANRICDFGSKNGKS